MKTRQLKSILLALGLAAASTIWAQNWPVRPITLVVPFTPGGGTDAIARALATRISTALGQNVVVDNRAGAGGAIAANSVLKAPADGYTLLFGTVSTLVVLPLTQPVSYDVAKDFAPIGLVAKAPNVLLVSPKIPPNTVNEFIAYAKANPNKLNFASSGQGTITHLIGELFKMQAGIDVQHVPYKTGVQALGDLVSGQVQFSFDSIVWSLPQVQAGKLKGIAITSATRSTLAPDIPTVAESGLPGFEGITWYALVVATGTPENVMQALRSALNASQQDKALVDRIANFGAEPLIGGRLEYDNLIRSETLKWSKVINMPGVKTP